MLSAFSAANAENFQAEFETQFFAFVFSSLLLFSAISQGQRGLANGLPDFWSCRSSLRLIRGYTQDAEAAEMIAIECLIRTNPNWTTLR
jgi:hypothetical protein